MAGQVDVSNPAAPPAVRVTFGSRPTTIAALPEQLCRPMSPAFRMWKRKAGDIGRHSCSGKAAIVVGLDPNVTLTAGGAAGLETSTCPAINVYRARAAKRVCDQPNAAASAAAATARRRVNQTAIATASEDGAA